MKGNLSKNLSLIGNDEVAAILIRHAERDSIPNLSHGTNVLLTEKGKRDAHSFGEKLRGRTITCAYTSPVQRCGQTARAILAGYGNPDGAMISTNLLGAPGAYIEDGDLAGRYFLDLGTTTTVNRYIETGELEGFKPLKAASIAFLSQISNDLARADNDLIYVSHDAVIIPLISWLTGEDFGYRKWLVFMDGAIITKNKETMSIIRNGVKTTIPIKMIGGCPQ